MLSPRGDPPMSTRGRYLRSELLARLADRVAAPACLCASGDGTTCAPCGTRGRRDACQTQRGGLATSGAGLERLAGVWSRRRRRPVRRGPGRGRGTADDGRTLAVVRLRVQRSTMTASSKPSGTVRAVPVCAAPRVAAPPPRPRSAATMAKRGPSVSTRLLEVVRDWTPPSFVLSRADASAYAEGNRYDNHARRSVLKRSTDRILNTHPAVCPS